MGLILFITFIVLIWIAIKLVAMLGEEIYRQHNPHHYLSKESIAKQRDETRKHYRNFHKQYSSQQFEKPSSDLVPASKSSRSTNNNRFKKVEPIEKELRFSVDQKTQDRLYTLVGGDMRTARRLVEAVRQSNPRRSYQWHWEKVIYDLERDKGMH